MKKHIVATLIASTLVMSVAPAMAAENAANHGDKETAIGLGSGIAAGALVGGPIGAIVGGFAGALMGKSVADDDYIKEQDKTVQQQQAQIVALNERQQSLETLQAQYADAQRQLKAVQTARSAKLEELTIGMDVQFRTGTYDIEPHFAKQLDDIAFAMSMAPELTLDLSGYADRSGNSDTNLALSEQRVAAVKGYLVDHGVDASRLNTQAYGDTAPLMAEQSAEGNFFDRRVSLRLQNPEAAMTANRN
ncbi:sortase-associated OmpA-like protein PdsO [Shewanella sp. C32]|uniref:Sortase-associated OmpA-like protein PdsO n=1 Tax=Shewanella electrica TaxID=515560 RepID=A0ABT2FNE0_9GAMM|nr:sortase-associated OmpA-like protein PdsO [Shewanella electrica]MCH1924859.1 sortase-associated OmpA-like protein PdsO [Shewanella electrica]MCS4556696.1 sortase-associated OmpA-like protein PdsO [Shewanella electrica]